VPLTERLRHQLSGHPRAAAAAIGGGAVVLLAVAVGLAITVFSPRPTGDASPVPSPSATPSAAPTSNTSPSPTSTEPSSPAGDSFLQVSVDGLRMRATTSTSAAIVRSLDRGEVVRVTSGPVDADGYEWYEVVDLDSRNGWVAMGDGGAPWLEAFPADPATSELLLRLERDCDVSLRGMVGIPVVPPNVTITADGRVVLGSSDLSFPGLVRQLSPSGFAQVQREVLDLPVLQESAHYVLERLPNTPDPPGHGLCGNRFTLGEGTGKVEVTGVGWLYQEEGVYWVPSPERHALEELAIHLLDVETWLGPGAWSEPIARRYVASSYLFWLSPQGGLPSPPDVNAPVVTGAGWPFAGPIEQFGEPVGQERCGYLDLGQTFETLRLMRELGVPTNTVGVDPPRQLSLDGFGTGNLTTGTGWVSFWLTSRSPDGYPSCLD